MTSRHIISHNITPHHITSHHITPHHIKSHEIASHYMTWHHQCFALPTYSPIEVVRLAGPKIPGPRVGLRISIISSPKNVFKHLLKGTTSVKLSFSFSTALSPSFSVSLSLAPSSSRCFLRFCRVSTSSLMHSRGEERKYIEE